MNLVCGWALRDLSHLKLQQNCACLGICALLRGEGPQLALVSVRVWGHNKAYEPQSYTLNIRTIPSFHTTVWCLRLQRLQTDHLSLKHSSATCFIITLGKFLTLSMSQFPYLKNGCSITVILRVNLANTDKVIRTCPP